MNVPTATILISQDKKSISKVLQKLGSGAPIVDLVGQFSREQGVLLFSNQANPNFISFSHNLIGNELECVLEFIDPKNEFEENFLSSRSVFASLKEYLNKRNFSGKERSVIEDEKIAEERKSASKLSRPSGAASTDIQLANQKKVFYISFGIGDNIRYWSRVQRVELTGVILDPSKSRKFTLKFAALSRPLSKVDRVGIYNELIDLNTLGNSTSVTGYSKLLNFQDYYFLKDPIYGEKDAETFPVDIHLLIVDTLRDYIRKASLGANVIVLLPDLTKTCASRFKQIVSESSTGPYETENLKSSLDSFLSEIGMDLISNEPFSMERIPIEVASLDERMALKPIERLEFDLRNYKYYATLKATSSEGIPDFMGPLAYCIDKINSISQGTYTFTSCYMDETDTEVLNYWAENNSYPFNGDQRFDPDAPTVIVGDQSLISNYLYFTKSKSGPIPIHKQDRPLAFQEYREKIASLVGNYDNDYVFGDLYQAPDEFGYLDETFSEKETKLIESEQIPIFRYNTDNPNVLDLQAVDNGTYFTNINLAFSRNVDRIASTVRDGGVNVTEADFPILTQEALVQAIILSKFSQFGPALSDEQIIKEILRRLDPELERDLFGDVLDRAKAIKGFIDFITSDTNNVTVHIDQEINAAPAILMSKFADFLTRVKRQAKIKTLPFFNLSNRSLINGSPCVLFAQDAPVLSQVTQQRTRFNNFVTGLYGVTGFKHTITQRDVSSEFTLVKIDNSDRFKEEGAPLPPFPPATTPPPPYVEPEAPTGMVTVPPRTETK